MLMSGILKNMRLRNLTLYFFYYIFKYNSYEITGNYISVYHVMCLQPLIMKTHNTLVICEHTVHQLKLMMMIY